MHVSYYKYQSLVKTSYKLYAISSISYLCSSDYTSLNFIRFFFRIKILIHIIWIMYKTVISLKYFSVMPTLSFFNMFMSLFFSPPTCLVRAIALFYRHFSLARIVGMRPVVIDIYICIYVQFTSIYFSCSSFGSFEKQEEKERSNECVNSWLVYPSDRLVHSLFSLFFSFYRGQHTKKKEEKGRGRELLTCALYMWIYCIWTHCHFRQTHFAFR